MDTRILILLSCVAVVAVIAAFIIYRDRQKQMARRNASMRNLQREPNFGLNEINGLEENADDLDFSEEWEEEKKEKVDPVVEELSFQEKVALAKRNLANKPIVDIETEVSEEEISRAKQFFPNDVVSLMVKSSPEKSYAGYELLQALLSSGLRFGKMNIFHRYQHANNTNAVLFSLASAVKPGTFEMPKMGGFSTPALMLFMQVSTQKDPANAFEAMLETARQLVDDLEGEICDDQRQPLTDEKVAAIRMVFSDYESARANKELFV